MSMYDQYAYKRQQQTPTRQGPSAANLIATGALAASRRLRRALLIGSLVMMFVGVLMLAIGYADPAAKTGWPPAAIWGLALLFAAAVGLFWWIKGAVLAWLARTVIDDVRDDDS